MDSMTDAIRSLRERIETRLKTDTHNRHLIDPVLQKAFLEIVNETRRETAGSHDLLFRARLLRNFAEKIPVEPELILQGSQRFCHTDACSYGHNIIDYPGFLREGLPERRRRILSMPAGMVKEAFLEAIDAFACYIRRHDGCEPLAERPPRTLREALQLIWFMQIFLHAEGASSAVSFGNLDRCLEPYLSSDPEHDFELICAFLLKCCEGDESQNLTLSGGASARMILQAMRLMNLWQPSLSLKVDARTAPEIWDEALALTLTGSGMPSYFNAPVIAESLTGLGFPPERAEDWAVVGCYEATSPGDTLPLTVGGGFALPEIFARYLSVATAGNAADFLDGFRNYFAQEYRDRILPEFNRDKAFLKEHSATPFESLCIKGCIENNRHASDGGAIYNLFGVNILGIGTLVDSIHAVNQLVYEDHACTLRELVEQTEQDFPDENFRRRCRSLSGKYGTDTPETNELAWELSSFIADVVLSHPLADGTRPCPGFFRFGSDITGRFPATPDGRRREDRCSYGCNPSEGTAASPTAILNSAAHIDQRHSPCGNPVLLSFSRKDLDATKLRRLIESYFAEGGTHLHVNIVSPEELLQARAEPERFSSLQVRVSGYSARFVTLDSIWQNAVIERTKKGF